MEKSEVLKRALGVTFRNNVFMSADNIVDILQDELDTFLDPDMESYVMADDYYEPWMPDYDCEDALKSTAKNMDWYFYHITVTEIHLTGRYRVDDKRAIAFL